MIKSIEYDQHIIAMSHLLKFGLKQIIASLVLPQIELRTTPCPKTL